MMTPKPGDFLRTLTPHPFGLVGIMVEVVSVRGDTVTVRPVGSYPGVAETAPAKVHRRDLGPADDDRGLAP